MYLFISPASGRLYPLPARELDYAAQRQADYVTFSAIWRSGTLAAIVTQAAPVLH